MGILMSKFEDLESLQFVRFPTKPSGRVEKVIRVGDLVFARLGERKIACSRDISNFAYPPNSLAFPWMDSAVEAAFKLGCISKASMDGHIAIAAERAKQQSAEYAADSFKSSAEELGIKLTAAQEAKIASARRTGKGG